MAGPNQLDLTDIHFEVHSDAAAQDFIYDNGMVMRDLTDAAYCDSLTAAFGDGEHADAVAAKLTYRDEPEHFVDGLADPQTAVERGVLNPGHFANTRLVTAHKDGIDLVGFAISHDNTSGRFAGAKMRVSPAAKIPLVGGKRYAWQQLEVVRSDSRRHGVAEAMGYLSLAERHSEQPAAAYTWPSLLSSFAKRLERVGFSSTDVQENAGPDQADLVRFAAPVAVVMGGIRNAMPNLERVLATTRIERYGR